MMRRLIIISLLLIVSTISYAKKSSTNVDTLNIAISQLKTKTNDIDLSIDGLSKQIDVISYTVETQKDIISQEQSAIGNSMSSINAILTFFSIILTLGGAFLGFYIRYKERNVKKMLREVEEKKKNVKSMLSEVEEKEKNVKNMLSEVGVKKKEVETLEEKTIKTREDIRELNNTITKDIEALYTRLRREETVTFLKRLVYEPEDIDNLINLLLSRDLEENDFKYLLLAYRKLKDRINSRNYKITKIQKISRWDYLILFFQQFCEQSIGNKLVRDDLIEMLPPIIKSASNRDIDRSTNSLVMCLNKNINNENDNLVILLIYLEALVNSQFKYYPNPYEIIASKYKNDKELKELWSILESKGIINQYFGSALCERFKDDDSYTKSIMEKIEKSIQNTTTKQK